MTDTAKHQITVTIAGPTGSGKSVLWLIISKAIAAHGIQVNDADQIDGLTQEQLAARIEHVKDRFAVSIIEKNVRRS